MKAAWMVVAVAVGGCARSGDAPAGENGSASLLSLGALNVRVPSRANAPIRIERAGAPGVFLEVTALGARDVPGQALDGRTVFADAFPETEVVHTYTSDRVEELRRVARGGGDRSLHYRIALGPELSRLRVVNGVVEALDRNGIARLRTERAWFVDATGTKRWLEPAASARDGAWSLDYAIDTTGVEYPITIDPAWTPTTFLAKARRDHALIVLPTGKVIAISGSSTDGITKTTEIYDPATSSWTAGGSVITPRWYFGSALLTSGKIFLIGNNSGTETPELFDPVAGTSEALPDMPVSAYAPTVTELPGGKVLVVAYGGAMVFDLTARTWGSALGTESGRDFHSVAPLGSGKFLIAGGLGTGAALYDSSTSTWKAAAPMHVARENPALQPLPGGKALAAAGCGVTSAEIYDSSTNTWTMTGSLTQAHCYGGSVVLGSGRVLVVAGDLPDGVSDLAEEFDPTTGVWRSAGHLSGPRDEFGIVPLPVERALVVGGTAGVTTPAVEIFAPMELGKTCVGPAEC
ncbi:MAG: Kelch repeat-containing protein, partial [Polyangiales bacterium]